MRIAKVLPPGAPRHCGAVRPRPLILTWCCRSVHTLAGGHEGRIPRSPDGTTCTGTVRTRTAHSSGEDRDQQLPVAPSGMASPTHSNAELALLPMVVTATMMTAAIRATMMAYSTAVAPSWRRAREMTSRIMVMSGFSRWAGRNGRGQLPSATTWGESQTTSGIGLSTGQLPRDMHKIRQQVGGGMGQKPRAH